MSLLIIYNEPVIERVHIEVGCRDRPKLYFSFSAENETVTETDISVSAENENETALSFLTENEN